MAATVPEKVMVELAVPSPTVKARPAVPFKVSAPLATDKVTVSLPAPTSTSEIVIALPRR